VSFAVITPLCCFSTRFIIVVVAYFFIDSVRKLLDTPSYFHQYFILKYPQFFLRARGEISHRYTEARKSGNRYEVDKTKILFWCQNSQGEPSVEDLRA